MLKELSPEIGALHDCMGMDVPEPRAFRRALVHVYDALHRAKMVRYWSGQRRAVDPATTDISKYITPLSMRLWYWVIPVLIFAACFAFQNMCLHVTTHLYIKYMDKVIAVQGATNITSGTMLDSEDVAMVQSCTMYDVLGDLIGRRVHLPMAILDMAGLTPLALHVVSCLVTSWLGDSQIALWVKTFFVASVMALVKGILDLVTIMPDSRGWQACRDALTSEGVAGLRDLNLGGDLWSAFVEVLRLELFGLPGVKGHVRYCADMMVSGHTYFATLFSLSTYKMLRYHTQQRGLRWVRLSVGVICIVSVICEVALVAMNKFHYTVDMLASIILVVLLWDSVHVETVAATFVEGYAWRDASDWRWRGLCPFLGLCPGRGGFPRRKHGAPPPEICASRSRRLVDLWLMYRIYTIDAV
jgi:hypothetical protein